MAQQVSGQENPENRPEIYQRGIDGTSETMSSVGEAAGSTDGGIMAREVPVDGDQTGERTVDVSDRRDGEKDEGGDPDIVALARQVEALQNGTERGINTGEMPPNVDTMPDGVAPGASEYREQVEKIQRSLLERIKTALKYLTVKPAAWLGRKIVEHPFKAAFIVLATFMHWYLSAPLTAGLSGLAEEGVALSAELLRKILRIDSTYINIFDDLVGGGLPVM